MNELYNIGTSIQKSKKESATFFHANVKFFMQSCENSLQAVMGTHAISDIRTLRFDGNFAGLVN